MIKTVIGFTLLYLFLLVFGRKIAKPFKQLHNGMKKLFATIFLILIVTNVHAQTVGYDYNGGVHSATLEYDAVYGSAGIGHTTEWNEDYRTRTSITQFTLGYRLKYLAPILGIRMNDVIEYPVYYVGDTRSFYYIGERYLKLSAVYGANLSIPLSRLVLSGGYTNHGWSVGIGLKIR